MNKKKVILIINDGWGLAPKGKGNFLEMAKKPFFDKTWKEYPHCKIQAAGEAVGLPKHTMGNSEVGHLHMGAGRVVWQLFERINNSIKDKSFFKNKVFLKAMNYVKQNNSVLHLMGLCSDKGVHSHTDHLFALLKMAKQQKVKEVFIHFFDDGRDSPEKSAGKYVKLIEKECKKIGIGKIVSMIGRYYAMDRDHNYNRTKEAYDLLVSGKGKKVKNAISAVKSGYKRGAKTDYYIKETVIGDFEGINDKDACIFFDFRTDRPRQLTEAFTSKNFKGFKRAKKVNTYFVTMTEYDERFTCDYAFSEPTIANNLGAVLAKHRVKQLRLAETEKYAHVTYFFNSEDEEPNKGEERIMVDSPKVPSYDLKPEMSAFDIVKEADHHINNCNHEFILINFANCDLVGHSGVKKAIIRAVEVVDACNEMIVAAGLANDYSVLITADHGNAEDKIYPNGKIKPAHSENPVPFILVSNDKKLIGVRLKNGSQIDVAPTVLKLMGIKKPKEMSGKSLF